MAPPRRPLPGHGKVSEAAPVANISGARRRSLDHGTGTGTTVGRSPSDTSPPNTRRQSFASTSSGTPAIPAPSASTSHSWRPGPPPQPGGGGIFSWSSAARAAAAATATVSATATTGRAGMPRQGHRLGVAGSAGWASGDLRGSGGDLRRRVREQTAQVHGGLAGVARSGGGGASKWAVGAPLPSKLSCGYCGRKVAFGNLDAHEHRCQARENAADLFSTPCVSCGEIGPHCRCWALKNHLMPEERDTSAQQAPLFNLFRKGLQRGAGAGGGQGEVPLPEEEMMSEEEKARKAKEDEWRRARDAWLFGRPGESARVHMPGHSESQEGVSGMASGETSGGGGAAGSAGVGAGPSVERDGVSLSASRASDGPGAPVDGQAGLLPGEGGGSGGGGGGSGAGRGTESGLPGGRGVPPGSPGSGASATPAVGVRGSTAEKEKAFAVRERAARRGHFERMQDLARVQQYMDRWHRLIVNPPAELRHCDIPWLPRLSAKLPGGAEPFDVIGVSEGAGVHAKKAALRAASLRWHPDKFMTRWGALLAEEERERVLKDAQAMIQRITALRQRLNAAGAACTHGHGVPGRQAEAPVVATTPVPGKNDEPVGGEPATPSNACETKAGLQTDTGGCQTVSPVKPA